MTALSPAPSVLIAHNGYDLDAVGGDWSRALPGLMPQARTPEALRAALPGAEVLVVSGLWDDALLDHAPRLRFIQTFSAGVDRFDLDAIAARGIRLASANGVNARPVAEHALMLVLALLRGLGPALAGQGRAQWTKPQRRPDEIAGKTVFVVGTGPIGVRLSEVLAAMGCRVEGFRRAASEPFAGFAAVHALGDLPDRLPGADVVILACPLTPQTRYLIGAAALARMKPSALVVNVARGGCVDQPALIAALREGRIAGAALDVTDPEPPGPEDPVWHVPGLLITPHTGGETHAYEARVLELLVENLARLAAGREDLVNRRC